MDSGKRSIRLLVSIGIPTSCHLSVRLLISVQGTI